MKSLLVKFLCDSANSQDLDKLNDWVQDERYARTFKEYVKTHFAITISMNKTDKEEIKKKLLKEIRKEKNYAFRRTTTTFLRYAAIVIFILGMGYVFKDEFYKRKEIPQQSIVPRTDQITLKLGNGEVKVLNTDDDANIQTSNGKWLGTKKGNTLEYGKETADGELVYNTLKVPNAKRFNIVLSDGTKVHLNSGSSLRYPVNFSHNGKREVFLEGEAFLEVAHDKEHPFVVRANDLNVEVLGTRFNLSNYGEKSSTEVVLVDGLVSLETASESPKSSKMILEPGFMGSFDQTTKDISKEKVNTALYTSWIDGNIVIRDESFGDILIKLERFYNVTIINNNEKLTKERFNATIETEKESIEQVLNYFKQVYQIDYEIVENKVVIN
ncbi:DUF4974 domain-containing protein [Muricauda sp. HICW]|uniref:DUF4974 domain-containing protein n=1 Tax=Flagellimonas chongwuensis TaxID=2697365 RepID=A0A850NG33_9FLAO|nr:FecR family protein [Allomuricauda chongwuensis]NVN19054.1 DUF4974 domain-containing protein [Allomuricauda chongwuensis]